MHHVVQVVAELFQDGVARSFCLDGAVFQHGDETACVPEGDGDGYPMNMFLPFTYP